MAIPSLGILFLGDVSKLIIIDLMFQLLFGRIKTLIRFLRSHGTKILNIASRLEQNLTAGTFEIISTFTVLRLLEKLT